MLLTAISQSFFAAFVVLFLIAGFWMTFKAARKGTLKKNGDGLCMEEVRPLGPAYVLVFRILIFTAIVALAYPLLSPTLCENYTCKSSVWFSRLAGSVFGMPSSDSIAPEPCAGVYAVEPDFKPPQHVFILLRLRYSVAMITNY
jgi:hypothetical protein